MNLIVNPAPVRKAISVKVPPPRAFTFFTSKMMRWWRPDHHIGKLPFKEIVLEPRAGGRWYEVDEHGAACEWGKVLAWEPPNRIVLAWQLTSSWQYDADFVTELEVRFIPEGEGTRVELEHRNLERFGDKTAEIRAALDSPGGWTGAMVDFAAAADREA